MNPTEPDPRSDRSNALVAGIIVLGAVFLSVVAGAIVFWVALKP